MKEWHVIALLVLIIIVALALFSGFLSSVPKLFRSSSNQMQHIDSTKIRKQQERRIDDVREQQKQMIELQKQRIRDMSR